MADLFYEHSFFVHSTKVVTESSSKSSLSKYEIMHFFLFIDVKFQLFIQKC